MYGSILSLSPDSYLAGSVSLVSLHYPESSSGTAPDPPLHPHMHRVGMVCMVCVCGVCPYAHPHAMGQTKEKATCAVACLRYQLVLTDYGYNLPFW